MYELIHTTKRIFALFGKKEKSKILYLQFFILLMTLGELVAIASILPFINIATNPSLIQENIFLSNIYNKLNFSDLNFTILMGIGIIIILFLSSLNSVYTSWRLFNLSSQINASLTTRLYKNFINKDWLYHTQTTSAKIIYSIISECRRLSDAVISPIIQLWSKLFFIIILLIATIVIEPLISLAGIVIFAITYLIIFNITKYLLTQNDLTIKSADLKRTSLVTNSFNAIKDIIFYDLKNYYTNLVDQSNKRFGSSQALTRTVGQTPRFFIEFVLFTSIILLILFLLYNNQNEFSKIIPQLTLFTIISIKLIPAFQVVYSNFVQIKGNISSLNDLEDKLKIKDLDEENSKPKSKSFQGEIKLEAVKFKYPTKPDLVFRDLNLEIKKNSFIGIVGKSGSGKSTLIDLITGMIQPQSGIVKIDNIDIQKIDIKNFRKTIGLVHQNIFLVDGSIKENIAFGSNSINDDEIIESLKLAGLYDYIKSLPNTYDTVVGNNAIQLSGGQRQRISIARALYGKKNILIFDEATSSLDKKVESNIINNFSSLKDVTKIMISHKLNNLEKCDKIYVIENGRVVSSGNYQELKGADANFRELLEK